MSRTAQEFAAKKSAQRPVIWLLACGTRLKIIFLIPTHTILVRFSSIPGEFIVEPGSYFSET